MEFVIPDETIQQAAELLVAAGYLRCTDSSCPELEGDRAADLRSSNEAVIAKNRCHPVGAAHFHLKDGFVVHLLPQSEILPWLPRIQPGPPADDDRDLMLSTDAHLPPATEDGPSGPLVGLHSMKILNPDSFTESVMRLECRDIEVSDRLLGRWSWMSHVLRQNQVGRSYLRPKFRAAWDCFNQRGELYEAEMQRHGRVHMYLGLLMLREELIAEGQLPQNLPVIDKSDY